MSSKLGLNNSGTVLFPPLTTKYVAAANKKLKNNSNVDNRVTDSSPCRHDKFTVT
jgi:hypothetical protein